ncbi:MAG: hypothetical protein SVY15_08655 [Halobacteriota archaeon]|nr:hypothetical protein [Halobacteriota archaeon]
MFEEYVPICFAVKRCEEIRGRKKFQKMFYLSKEAGIPILEDFNWNNYGPYSRELAYELDSLCTMKLLSEERIGMEYVYKITEEGTSFLEKSLSSGDQRIDERFAKFLEILNKYDSSELEKIASVGFLKRDGYDDSYIQDFLEYAKNYSLEDVETGRKEFSDLLKRFEGL